MTEIRKTKLRTTKIKVRQTSYDTDKNGQNHTFLKRRKFCFNLLFV